ncbi:uncharacterized protein LOC130713645 [Lotus japonicus]|uniref:uncharacterized protein LOC130713645 n=1 Tax=Lotus japonicus TaxID=34305 RepID=UPI002586D265|nr:uncharacterized protein LOC130713645 [Lotus japonicus]
MSSLLQEKQDAVTGGFLSSACSWRDIVARELHRHVLSPAEDCLFVGLGRWNKDDERVPVKILFPEITIKRLGSAGCSNFPDASLFPEAFGRDILVDSTVLPVSEVACGVELVERGVMCGPLRPCEVPPCLHGGSSQKLWLTQVGKEFHVLCGDQRPLFRLAFIGVVPDAGWLVEAPHFWSMVREVVDSMAIRIPALAIEDALSSVGPADLPSGSDVQVLGAVGVASSSASKCRGRPKKTGRGTRATGLVGRGAVRDQGLTPLPSRPRGRPRKVRNPGSELELGSGSSSKSGVEDLVCNQLALLEPLSPSSSEVMTRARSALAMGKRMRMVYDCSDEVALQGIADNIRSRRLVYS